MLIILTAVLGLSLSSETQPLAQPVEATQPATAAASTRPASMVIARGPTLTGETRTICQRERVMDSNIPQRVCRVVPVNSSQRARVNDDHIRELQRLPGSAENMPSRSPGGRSVF